MNEKDIEDHKIVAGTMSCIELNDMITDLIQEKNELIEYLKPQEIERYDIVIEIYKFEHKNLIDFLSIRNHSKLFH